MAYKLHLRDLDFGDFIKTLDACKGDVFLETEDGDILNLKSKLCQIVGINNILKGARISEATIRCTLPEDEGILFRFNLYQSVPEKDNEEA